MSSCPDCGTAVDPTAVSCSACGASTGATLESEAPPSTAGRSSRPGARFEAGDMVGERYRIVGLLGRGGMGEVYRADDLELGQPVALKFLPEDLTADTAALERFRSEVRTARQVAHPNVCRTYDIGSVAGHVFLSMEFVDGEDLSSALRRMGRPSPEKAFEIARQLCLGLAAAHENGVLHRDLKPANVMIDGRGRVRITDFGLAGLIDELGEDRSRAGTPAYMAPEQLDQGLVSVRSDIYALGLVLHEIFTGKRVYDADTLAELREQHESTSLSGSSGSSPVDPAVERLVSQCLEREPARRPASVYAVLGALPGGDPIAAALAAGETPSPDLVAAAGESGALAPRLALGLLLFSLAALALTGFVKAPGVVNDLIELPVSADELEIRAKDLLEELGHRRERAAIVRGLQADFGYIDWITAHDDGADRWERLRDDRPAPASFWLRLADSPMDPAGAHLTRPTRSNPPVAGPGSTLIELSPRARLLRLLVVPGNEPDSPPPPVSLDELFERAGLVASDFEETVLLRPPPLYCEARAFRGPGESDLTRELVVQVGHHEGRLVYFELLQPWMLSGEARNPNVPPAAASAVMVVAFLALCGLAWRNLKLGRGDRVGALRLAAFVTLSFIVAALLTDLEPLKAPMHAIGSIVNGKALAHALMHSLLAWLAYVALEPHARRLWPRTLVTWTRLLRGGWSDPLVGRDLLLGAAFAGLTRLIFLAGGQAQAALDRPAATAAGFLEAWDLPVMLGLAINGLSYGLLAPMAGLTLLVICRLLLRRPAWASAAAVVIASLFLTLAAPPMSGSLATDLIGTAALLVVNTLFVLILTRLGLLALVATAVIGFLIGTGPMTLDFERWYAGIALVPPSVAVALALWGFWTTGAPRGLLREDPAEA